MRILTESYFAIGAVTYLFHPDLGRRHIRDLKVQYGVGGFALAGPVVLFLVFLPYCACWPLFWVTAANAKEPSGSSFNRPITDCGHPFLEYIYIQKRFPGSQ